MNELDELRMKFEKAMINYMEAKGAPKPNAAFGGWFHTDSLGNYNTANGSGAWIGYQAALAQAPVVPEWVGANNILLVKYATNSVVLRGRISRAGYDIDDNEEATERAWQIIRDLKDPK